MCDELVMIDSSKYSKYIIRHNAKVQYYISIAGLVMIAFLMLPTLQVVSYSSEQLASHYQITTDFVLDDLVKYQIGLRCTLILYFLAYLTASTSFSKYKGIEATLIQTFPFIVVGLLVAMNAITLLLGSALESYFIALCVVFTFVVMPLGKSIILAALSVTTVGFLVKVLPLEHVDRFDLLVNAVSITGLFALIGVINYIEKVRTIDIERELTVKNSQLKSNLKTLRTLSATDSVTGIPNRREFDLYIDKGIDVKMTASMMLIDIDYFKEFNDTYGHQKGDECLRNVASALSNALKRDGDTVFRYGGEEFVVVLPNTDTVGALHIAERLRASVLDLRIPHEKRRTGDPYVTISIGVGTPNLGAETVPSLLELADQNMYKAKQLGRNRVFPDIK